MAGFKTYILFCLCILFLYAEQAQFYHCHFDTGNGVVQVRGLVTGNNSAMSSGDIRLFCWSLTYTDNRKHKFCFKHLFAY